DRGVHGAGAAAAEAGEERVASIDDGAGSIRGLRHHGSVTGAQASASPATSQRARASSRPDAVHTKSTLGPATTSPGKTSRTPTPTSRKKTPSSSTVTSSRS